MAGGYTHLTLVRSSLREGRRKIPSLQDVLDQWGRFTYLGGVSPDYPYLGLDSDWADLMHKGRTDQIIKCAMPLLHQARMDNPTSQIWRQQFAWLLGVVSHIIADVTIHPVVNIRVGKYEANKDAHRRCEMNQDVWIYREVTGLDLQASDNMKGEIRSCGTAIDLNDDIENLWKTCLETSYAPLKLQDDQIDKWHAFFVKLVDLAEVGRKIPVFGRHMVSGSLAYPDYDALDQSFFQNIEVPITAKIIDSTDTTSPAYEQPKDRGRPSSFLKIFEKTRGHILEAWAVLASDLLADDKALGLRHVEIFGDWSLDTGVDNASKQLRLWPWSEKLVKS